MRYWVLFIILLLVFSPTVATAESTVDSEDKFEISRFADSKIVWNYEPYSDVEYTVNTSVTNPDPPIQFVKNDRDDDGYIDYNELQNPKLSVDKKNVVVQVSYADEVNLSRIDFDRLQQLYMRNADIQLRFVVDDEPRINDTHYTADDYESRLPELKERGVHHIALIQYVGNQQTYGVTVGGRDASVIQTSRFTGDHVLSTINHELGHQLGLDTEFSPAIDSHEQTYDEYPSVMNYNRPSACYILDGVCAYVPVYNFTDAEWEHIQQDV